MANTELRICDVCKLVDNDNRIKICSYCSLCDAWICQPDIPRLDRRAQAMILKQLKNKG